ncbi:uncharacterized protein LOC122062708 isoform X2 [Macadamia integrifolia]|uniref:uncharacterized protein LOC122062708 isoform X2 n=1 Tax=Macadamia integrifolia TaxID=60698 RepID=UPI001C4FD3F1|nr:uncharacterized protein LOC122062708 isoform X2 [Macadamia integrifolia]
MTGSRCNRRKMMGRGAEGGCGTEEKPCPVSRVSSTKILASGEEHFGVDFYVQARKALSVRSPYDTEEAVLSRVPILPFGLSDFLSKYSESRKRHKKSHSESAGKSLGHDLIAQTPTLPSIWVETEDCFRPVTLTDIENLVAVSSFGSSAIQAYLSIPWMSDATIRTCDNALEVSTSSQKNEEEEEQFLEIDGGGADVLSQNEMGSSVRPPTLSEVGTLPLPEEGSSVAEPSSLALSSIGLQWLMGSRNKSLLTSERPSKKRKLLGGDAGLERLVITQPSEGHESPVCHVCCLCGNGEPLNKMLVCELCKVSVHQKCYGVETFPDGPWLCSWCKLTGAVENSIVGNVSVNNGDDVWLRPCVLCPKQGGALKPIAKGAVETEDIGTVKFAHLVCCQWLPEVYVQDLRTMEPIMNVEGIKGTRRKLVCYLCKVKYGACIRCSHGTCRTSFHPICAREAKHRMEIWGKIGTDNVELRAFCLKHSVYQDTTVTQQSSSPLPVVDGCETSVSQSSLTLVESEPHNSRLGIKSGEQSMVHCETTGINSNKSGDVEGTGLGSRFRPECGDAQLITMEALGRNSNGDIGSTDSLDFVRILKKIIDQGKAFVNDVALEIGISSESLTATFAGDHPSFSPGLQPKIIKWLGNHAYMGTSQKNLKVRSSSTISSRAVIAGPDGPNGVAVADSSHPDAVPVKSVPPRRTTKNNITILKDKKVLCSSGEILIKQNDDGTVTSEFNEQALVRNEELNDGSGNEFVSLNGDRCKDTHVTSKISLESSGHQEVGSSVDESPRSEAIGAESDRLKKVQDNMADTFLLNTFVDSNGEDSACAADIVTPVMHNPESREVSSTTYIHPFILKRMMHVQHMLSKQENTAHESVGSIDKDISSIEASDGLKLKQLIKARTMGILEYSPEDEVEGELIYYQNKLVDLTVSSQHYCAADLIFRVAKSLPEEMDAVRNQKWDDVLVYQYLCELREAKKRGRKEKRHKEAQAVLAAATAAAAASSRISSFRKDGHDEPGQHKVNTVSGRAGPHSQLMPRAKETLSRLAVSSASSEKQSNNFQLSTDFSKDSPRSCDVCRRSEKMLNPVLVCSNCKVAVHLGCYRNVKDPVGPWYCELCEELLPRSPGAIHPNSREKPCFIVQCGLCAGSTGAFRKSTDGQWVHAFCAEWMLESTFRKGQVNAVDGMETILKERDVCIVCCRRVGVCLKCNYGNCQSTFHPFCARNAGLYLHVKTSGGKVQHKGYCNRHSVEQREKAEMQHHGAEELKGIKQIRVELEKLRLLCERIIRREKLKFFVCSESWFFAHMTSSHQKEMLLHSLYLLIVPSSHPMVVLGQPLHPLKGMMNINPSVKLSKGPMTSLLTAQFLVSADVQFLCPWMLTNGLMKV